MKTDKEIRIIAKLLEEKTQLQSKALERTGASKRTCLTQIVAIDRAIEIVRGEFREND